MAKRFTDTDKWKDDWYISLSNDYKIVWQWLLDNCNHAGILKPSLSIMNMFCNVNFDEKKLLEVFENRVIKVGKIYFIPKFIKFQYDNLNSKKPAIISVVKMLKEYELTNIIIELFGNDYLMITQSLNNDLRIIKDKDKEKDMDKDKEKRKRKDNLYTADFENFWNIYEKKGTKNNAFKEWQKLSSDDKTNAVAKIKPYFESISEQKYRKDAERYLKHRVFDNEDFFKPNKNVGNEKTYDPNTHVLTSDWSD